jgi:hypothetical protein
MSNVTPIRPPRDPAEVFGELECTLDDLEQRAQECVRRMVRLREGGYHTDMDVFGVLCDTIRLARQSREGAQ